MATSTVSQSTPGHTSLSPSVGNTSHSTSSISTAAGESEAVVNQALPEGAAKPIQDPMTRTIPTQDPHSDLQGSAIPAPPVAHLLAATTPENNQLQVIAQVHAENIASQSADSVPPVPGLIELSAKDVQAVADSGVAPVPDLGTALDDITVGHQLSALQLGQESGSVPAPSTGQLATRPGPGPGPGTGDMPPPVTDQQAQASTEPLHPRAITHTGITLDATLSANSIQPGYERAAATFHGSVELPKALIQGAQPVGPDNEAEMPEDGDRQEPSAMDSSNMQTDAQNPSTSTNQQPGNLGATGQPSPAISFTSDAMANLLKAASAGHFWDVPGQLKAATAAHMQELQAVLQKMASSQQLAETDPDKDESEPDKVVIRVRHSSGNTSTSSDSSL